MSDTPIGDYALVSDRHSAALISRCLESKSYLCTHVGNVFYLSMLLGATVLEYVAAERKRQTLARDLQNDFAMDLTPLGLGAMVMDVGMLPLEHLFTKNRMIDNMCPFFLGKGCFFVQNTVRNSNLADIMEQTRL